VVSSRTLDGVAAEERFFGDGSASDEQEAVPEGRSRQAAHNGGVHVEMKSREDDGIGHGDRHDHENTGEDGSDPLSGSGISERHLGAIDNRRSVLFVRIRAARALQCVESLRRSDPAEEF